MQVSSYGTDTNLVVFMNQRMNTEEQQLFVNSFKLYLDYGRNDTAFVVDLDHVWEWIGFTRIDNAKRILIKSFNKHEDYVETNAVTRTGERNDSNIEKALLNLEERFFTPQNGGQNKIKTMMTVKTFKKLCMKAGTEKADKVREYYLKMEEILQDYTEQCLLESKQQLTLLNTTMKEVQKSAEWERHNALLAGYQHIRLVYILLIMRLSGTKFVIKIGSTADLRDRINKINSAMGITVKVLEVFPCGEHEAFEKKIHEIYQSIRYNELINDKVYSTETFIVENEKKFKSIKLRMQKEIHKYYHRSIEDQQRNMRELELHNETLRLQCVSDLLNIYKDKPIELSQLLQTVLPQPIEYPHTSFNTQQTGVTEPVSEITQEPISNNDYMPDTVEESHHETLATRIACREAVGPKVQLYDPADITKVVKVIDGLFQATVEVVSASLSAIKLAAKNKTIYKGYRWFLIDRDDQQPHAAKNIGATKASQIKVTGSMIAMLNIDTNLVENVFNNQVEASAHISQSTACICLALKSGSTTAGYHWKHWNSLTEEVQNEYLSRQSLPEPVANIKGHKVQRIDIITGDVLEEYMTQVDVYKKLGITPKSIKKASATKRPYNGFMWNIC